MRKLLCLALVYALCVVPVPASARTGAIAPVGDWSASEIRLLETLSLASLPPVAADWRNPLANNAEAAKIGKRLFGDPRLSGDGTLSCRSCHIPERYFQDGLATSEGMTRLERNAPSLLGVAYRRWLYWDGRKDSLWSQALEPIETAEEMNGTRAGVARLVLGDDTLRDAYERLFGASDPAGWTDWPPRASPKGAPSEQAEWEHLGPREQRQITEIFVNVGKAIAAFEATLSLPKTPFDRFVEALTSGDEARANELLSAQERHGLRKFISGESGCASCHLGPLFATDAFRNIGTVLGADGSRDPGQLRGRDALIRDDFNCKSPWSDAQSCSHLDALYRVEVVSLLDGSFRTPGLRNLVQTAPYMHDGRFTSLEEVMDHYRSPPLKPQNRHEIPRLDGLTDRDVQSIIAFLKVLSRDD